MKEKIYMKTKHLFLLTFITVILAISCDSMDSKNLANQVTYTQTQDESVSYVSEENKIILTKEELQLELERESARWHRSFEEIQRVVDIHYKEPRDRRIDRGGYEHENAWLIPTGLDYFTVTFDPGFVTSSGKPKASELGFYLFHWDDERYIGDEYIPCGGSCYGKGYIPNRDNTIPESEWQLYECFLCGGTGMMKNESKRFTICSVDTRVYGLLGIGLDIERDPYYFEKYGADLCPDRKELVKSIIKKYNDNFLCVE